MPRGEYLARSAPRRDPWWAGLVVVAAFFAAQLVVLWLFARSVEGICS